MHFANVRQNFTKFAGLNVPEILCLEFVFAKVTNTSCSSHLSCSSVFDVCLFAVLSDSKSLQQMAALTESLKGFFFSIVALCLLRSGITLKTF